MPDIVRLVLVCAGFALAAVLGLAPIYLPAPRVDPGIIRGPGRLDARAAEKPGRIALVGEWVAVWDRVVPPDRLRLMSRTAPAALPAAWSDLRDASGAKRPSPGCATFYLDAERPPGLDGVSIGVRETAFRLYANGTLVASAGLVSEKAEEGKAQRRPVVANAGTLPERVRFTLQVSNHAGVEGGPVGGGVVGRYAELRAEEAYWNLLYANVAGACSILGFYHLIVFLLRMKDRKRLYLSIFCTVSAFRIIVMERFFEIVFPGADLFMPLMRVGHGVHYASFAFLALYVRARFPRSFPKALAAAAFGTGAVFILVAGIAPLRIVQASYYPYAAYALAVSVVAAAAVAKAVRGGRKDAAWDALGLAFLIATSTYDVARQVLQVHGVNRPIYLMPIGFAAFLLNVTVAQSLGYLRLSDARRRLAAKLAKRGDDLKAIVDRKTRRLREANRRLLEANANRTAFFAAASHELRTPVTAMQLALRSVKEGKRDAAYRPGDPVFDVLSRQAARLGLQLDSFLTYARLELNALHPVPVTLDAGERLAYAAAGMRSLAESRGVSIEVSAPPGRPGSLKARLDPDLLDAAINNALDNMLRRCGDGGAIACAASAAEGGVRIRIECRGLALSPAEIEGLFTWLPEPEGQGARRASGTAIGLSLAKRIMEAMGGTLRAETEGSFAIVLSMPTAGEERRDASAATERTSAEAVEASAAVEGAVRPALAEEAGNSASEESPAAPMGEVRRAAREPAKRATILAVDDDKDLLSFLQDGLSRQFEVIPARDGEEALAELDRHPEISLIVSDVMMPGMDGIELCRRVRDVKRRPMPFIFLTARAMEEEMEEALHGGAVGYVVKPFAMDILAAKAASLIEFSDRQRDFMKRSIMDHLSGWDSSGDPGRAESAAPARRRSMEDAAKALGLTGRQAEILSLLVKGYTDSEIASYCGISTKTVSDHVRNILEKANVDNRTQLAYELLSGGDEDA